MIADRFSRSLLGVHHRKSKVEVGMYQLVVFDARGTTAAGIILRRMLTTHVLCIGNRQGKLPCALRTKKELCMTDTVVTHRLYQPLFHLLLSKYIPE